MQLFIDIKYACENEAAALKIHIISQRLAKIARTNDYQMMLFIQSEYLADLGIQILHVIAIPLLSEASEIIEILPDLGCGNMHQPAQLLRGNAFHATVLQFTKVPEISGKTRDYCL